MRCGLCGFLIIKPQTALHHAVWCGAVQDYLRCGAVMPFCGQFGCSFCGLCGLCGLVNTPTHNRRALELVLNHLVAFLAYLDDRASRFS